MIAIADRLELARFVVGGISLGAGTALNLAIRYPDRVTALVLCRPAWLDRPQAEFNRHAYTEIADLLEGYPPETAAARYTQSRTYQTVRNLSPAVAASLLGQLSRPRAAQNAVILCAFPGSGPTSSIDTWRAVEVPTLVIGHRDDPSHPYEIAEAYADTIPRLRFLRTDADPPSHRHPPDRRARRSHRRHPRPDPRSCRPAPRDGGGCRRERPRDRRIPHRPHPQRAHPGFNNIRSARASPTRCSCPSRSITTPTPQPSPSSYGRRVPTDGLADNNVGGRDGRFGHEVHPRSSRIVDQPWLRHLVAAPASHHGTNRETIVVRRQQMPQARSSLAA